MIRILSSIFAAIVLAAGLSTAAVGQTPKTINGGVLNGKAVSLAKPAYPADLRQEGLSGTVTVNIVVDEGGNVISAEAEPTQRKEVKNEDGTVSSETVDVHPSFRSASEAAALESKFSPTLLSGVPVQIKGKLVYSFAAIAGDLTRAAGKDPKVVSGGVLNSKALSLPLPAYPAAARAVAAEGAVNVQVTIDEEGNVISATAVSGHPLLRTAAANAASTAKFSPTQLSGQPVKVSGILTYNFVP